MEARLGCDVEDALGQDSGYRVGPGREGPLSEHRWAKGTQLTFQRFLHCDEFLWAELRRNSRCPLMRGVPQALGSGDGGDAQQQHGRQGQHANGRRGHTALKFQLLLCGWSLDPNVQPAVFARHCAKSRMALAPPHSQTWPIIVGIGLWANQSTGLPRPRHAKPFGSCGFQPSCRLMSSGGQAGLQAGGRSCLCLICFEILVNPLLYDTKSN